jgi:ATP-binding cassette subfamily F protein 3
MALGQLGDKVTDDILDRFGHDQERFADLGGYVYHARVDAVLQGLGFDAEESKERLVSTLSGGERGRVGLAAQLIAPADLLLLDEPTNHLDLDTTTWLQEWLKEADETVIVVSHDRAFLDAICTNILHIEAKSSESYKGNYSQFVPQRAERRLTRERELEKQRAYVKKEQDYIMRNLAGVNSFQAKGKRKRLERLPRLAPPPGDPAAMSLEFTVKERGGDQVVAIDALRVEVPGRVLVEDFTAVLRRNDFVALVGPNGAGKSSFISTLLGDRTPASGEARVGSSIRPAYFKQDLSDLPLRMSLSDAIQAQRPTWNRGQVQNHLGAFGFTGDEVFREISTLNIGSRPASRTASERIEDLRAAAAVLKGRRKADNVRTSMLLSHRDVMLMYPGMQQEVAYFLPKMIDVDKIYGERVRYNIIFCCSPKGTPSSSSSSSSSSSD